MTAADGRAGLPFLIAYCDGGSRGNPGRAGCGAVIFNDANQMLGFDCEDVGGSETNNVAEYSGALLALKLAARVGAGGGTDVVVRADSRLIVNQLSGVWQAKHPRLAELHHEVLAAASRFRSVRFEWVPREQNGQADALANDAMDGRAPQRPTPLAGEVSTRQGEATGAVRVLVPAEQRTTTSMVERLERAAALAAELGIDGTPADVAHRLVAAAPDELTAIFDRLPGAGWLTSKISASPLSWTRGRALATC